MSKFIGAGIESVFSRFSAPPPPIPVQKTTSVQRGPTPYEIMAIQRQREDQHKPVWQSPMAATEAFLAANRLQVQFQEGEKRYREEKEKYLKEKKSLIEALESAKKQLDEQKKTPVINYPEKKDDVMRGADESVRRIASLETQVKQLTVEKAGLMTPDEHISKVREEILKYSKDMATKGGGYETWKKATEARLQETIQEKERSLQEAKGRIAELEDKESQCQEALRRKPPKGSPQLERKLEEVKQQLQSEKESLEQSQKDLGKWKKGYTELKKKANECQARIETLEKETATLRAKPVETKKEPDQAMQKKINEKEEEIKKIKKDLEDTKQKWNIAEQSLVLLKFSTEEKSAMQQNISRLEKTLNEQKEVEQRQKQDMERRAKVAQETELRLNGELYELRSQISKLEKALGDKGLQQDVKEAYQNQLGAAKSQQVTLEKRLGDCDTDKRIAMEQKEALEEKARTQLRDLESATEKWKAEERKRQELEKELEEKQKSYLEQEKAFQIQQLQLNDRQRALEHGADVKETFLKSEGAKVGMAQAVVQSQARLVQAQSKAVVQKAHELTQQQKYLAKTKGQLLAQMQQATKEGAELKERQRLVEEAEKKLKENESKLSKLQEDLSKAKRQSHRKDLERQQASVTQETKWFQETISQLQEQIKGMERKDKEEERGFAPQRRRLNEGKSFATRMEQPEERDHDPEELLPVGEAARLKILSESELVDRQLSKLYSSGPAIAAAAEFRDALADGSKSKKKDDEDEGDDDEIYAT